MSKTAQISEKPRLRGVLHQLTFFASLPIGVLLVISAPAGIARVTTMVFALSVATLFGVSALYHRIQWSPSARAWVRRLDHASIYILVSGTYTPIMMYALEAKKSALILTIVWGISAAGIFIEMLVARVPKALLALTYIGLGWVAIAVFSEMSSALGSYGIVLLATGGILYTIGGAIYALKRPNPWPSVFGYHEIFHALVILGVMCHYYVVAFYLWK